MVKLFHAQLTRLGRTTFVNTLCGQTILEGRDDDDPANAHIEEGVRIKPVTVGTRGHFIQLRSAH